MTAKCIGRPTVGSIWKPSFTIVEMKSAQSTEPSVASSSRVGNILLIMDQSLDPALKLYKMGEWLMGGTGPSFVATMENPSVACSSLSLTGRSLHGLVFFLIDGVSKVGFFLGSLPKAQIIERYVGCLLCFWFCLL